MNELQKDNSTLAQYWQQSVNNDTAAFASIHAALFGGLYHYACKLLKNEELADDAVQELFIRVWNRREKVGAIQKVKSFFYTSLRRQILNQIRDSKVRQLKMNLLTAPAIEFTQEEIIIKKEEDAGMKEQVVQLLNTLPPRQREVIYLFYFENMTAAQIAEIMSVNTQSIQNLKLRALQKLRAENLLTAFLLLIASCLKS